MMFCMLQPLGSQGDTSVPQCGMTSAIFLLSSVEFIRTYTKALPSILAISVSPSNGFWPLREALRLYAGPG